MTDTTDAAVDTAAVTKRSAARPTPHHPPRLRRLTSTSNSIGPDFAKIALSLRVGPYGTRSAILTLETRVALTDSDSRRRFRRYWFFVRPISGLIRRIAFRQLAAELVGP